MVSTIEVQMEKLTFIEIQARLQQTDIVIIPVGSTEPHGHHLPINNDTLTAKQLSIKIAQSVSDIVPTLVAPAIPFGITGFKDFIGVFSLSHNTLLSLYREIANNLIRQGFKKLIFVNGHGGNTVPLHLVSTEIANTTEALSAVVQYWDVGKEFLNDMIETEGKIYGHAAEMETSLSWALGQRVEIDKLKKQIPPKSTSLENHLSTTYIGYGMDPISRNYFFDPKRSLAVFGDATLASKEKGVVFLQFLLKELKQFMIDIKEFSFSE